LKAPVLHPPRPKLKDMEDSTDGYINQAPYENPEQDLYVHDKSKVTTLANGEGESRYLVDVQEFMAMQKERDEARRTLALINAWQVAPRRDEQHLRKLLDDHGLSVADGEAMNSIIAQFGKSFSRL
jgi:hypothetical protein